jgi:hypothetical protein
LTYISSCVAVIWVWGSLKIYSKIKHIVLSKMMYYGLQKKNRPHLDLAILGIFADPASDLTSKED